jgi:TolA-binding protein
MKYLIAGLLILFGLKFGLNYITSEEFQKYGDNGNKPWTCTANNLLGEYYIMMSDYKRAYDYFQRSMKRCPKTKMAETAEFNAAESLEKMGHRAEAHVAYKTFAEKYPGSKHARVARNAADLLSSN